MSKFKIGDIVVPNRVCYTADGTMHIEEDWCDHRHKYQIKSIISTGAHLIGITNGRTGFYLDTYFLDRNFNLDDSECGPCKSMCKTGKKCGLYEKK